MDNKSLIVTDKRLLYKIKILFKNIFNKENQPKAMNYNNVVNQQLNKSSFTNEIKITPNEEKEKLLRLQRDYENGIITEEDMTQEQISKIEKLYVEQISKLRNDYTEYKSKTVALRKKLATNN